jgi:hypothetical protein
MTPDTLLGRPDRARQPVSKRGGLHCQLLGVDNDLSGTGDELLLRTFAPNLVILPDVTGRSGRPYPNGEHDYHPRPVAVYLNDIGTVRQVPSRLLGWGGANVLFTGVSYLLATAAGLVLLTADDWHSALPFLVFTAIWTFVATFVIVPAYRAVRTPVDGSALRDRVKRGDGGASYATTVFKPFGAGSPAMAWSKYRDALPADLGGRAVYGRVVRDEGVTVLQYWLFYYYNDWWNQHESDWEVVMVYLDARHTPLAVACSSHLGGTWRPWSAVEPTGVDKQHPTVYVARGSHALYFNTAQGVHDAVLHQPWAVLDFRGQLTVHGKQDRVGTPDPALGTESYELIVIPTDAATLETDDPGWPDWWWLQFRGRWGSRDGIQSPSIQERGIRWDHPVDWAATECEADSATWLDVIGAAEHPIFAIATTEAE